MTNIKKDILKASPQLLDQQQEQLYDGKGSNV